jgi:hypothetical protein
LRIDSHFRISRSWAMRGSKCIRPSGAVEQAWRGRSGRFRVGGYGASSRPGSLFQHSSHQPICVGSHRFSFNESANPVSKHWGTVDAGSTVPTKLAGDMLPGSSQRRRRRRQGLLSPLRTSCASLHTRSFAPRAWSQVREINVEVGSVGCL